MGIKQLMQSPIYRALWAILLSASTGNVLAQPESTVERHQTLEQQKEQITHASDFKPKTQVKERRLFNAEIKKDDAASQQKTAPKNN